MLKIAIFIGLGGFVGSISRYYINVLLHKLIDTNFPIGIMIINLLGCFLIGLLLGLFEKGNFLSSELRLFLTVGLLGSFTTFSSFTSDTINLLLDSEVVYVLIYICITVIAGIALTFFGRFIIYYFWS